MFGKEAGLKACTTTVVAVAASLIAACDSSPTTPSTPGPTIACPATQSVASPTGGATAVDYPKPATTGGAAPVTLTCKPPAGSSFPLGTTSVTCSAVDANQKSATCSFNVNVAKAPQLSATRFLAFGDSITEGKNGDTCSGIGATNCSLVSTMNLADRLHALQKMIAELEASPAAYPHVLQGMLASRYTAQTVEMANEGFGGEIVSDGKGRLNDVLKSSSAQTLLLLEGANDMNGASPPIASIVEDLRSMVRAARNRGMRVLVGTLLPQREHGCRAFDYCDGRNDTISMNAAIRLMAAAEGATLVDLYPVFDGQTGTLLGLDGLHPTDPGYAKIAETFFNAIRQQLEVP